MGKVSFCPVVMQQQPNLVLDAAQTSQHGCQQAGEFMLPWTLMLKEGNTLCSIKHQVKSQTLSMLKSAWYWGITALRGSVRIRTRVLSSRLCRGTTTGKRPTNSGIMPNSMRSRASTCRSKRSFSSMSCCVLVSPPRLARSAAAAALLPFPRLEGVPKPRYWKTHILQWEGRIIPFQKWDCVLFAPPPQNCFLLWTLHLVIGWLECFGTSTSVFSSCLFLFPCSSPSLYCTIY